jgi:DNA-binding transcriptional MerR regulator
VSHTLSFVLSLAAMSAIEKDQIGKLYHTIGEVAELLGVNHSLIRYWEKEFEVLKLKKNKKGNRLFTAKDIDTLRTIQHLLREKGYTIEGARKALKEKRPAVTEQIPEKGPDTDLADLVTRLQVVRAGLVALRDQL